MWYCILDSISDSDRVKRYKHGGVNVHVESYRQETRASTAREEY